MYETHSKSTPQKLTLCGLHLVILFIAYWLMFLKGIDTLGEWFGFPINAGDITRRYIIILCGIIYFIRFNINDFVFLKREMIWSQALTIALWIFIAYCTFSFTGGVINDSIGRTEYAGIALYLLGSFLNSVSEWTRYNWKKKPEHHGHLYTGGLFNLSRHINYFGDAVLFLGFAMITRSGWSYIIPASLVVLFIYVNIPLLESHLRSSYGHEFEDYSFRTDKFIPFIY